jgi:hypothetical protein
MLSGIRRGFPAAGYTPERWPTESDLHVRVWEALTDEAARAYQAADEQGQRDMTVDGALCRLRGEAGGPATAPSSAG